MMRKFLLATVAAFALGLAAPIAHAQTSTLKFSTMEAPSDPFVACFTQPMLAELKAATGGRLDTETYMGGTAFAHPLRQYEQVAQGVMDISQGVLSYSPGQFALAEVATMPFLIDDATIGAIALNRLAPTYLAEELKHIHLMALLVTPPQTIHMRGDFTGIDDLKGKRIRATGIGATALLKGLGITPIAMPAPAVYENLQKGVIDGALAEFTALQAFRIGEVTRTHVLANVSVALLFVGMNKARYDSLPADIREIIRSRFSGPALAEKAAACWERLGAEVARGLQAEGQRFVELSAADRARVMPVAQEVTAAYIADVEKRGKQAAAFRAALVAELAKLRAERKAQ